MIAVRVTVKQGSVLEALGRLALDRADKTALLGLMGTEVAENTRLRFLDGVAPDGTPWVPSIRARTQGGETMRDTGRLMNSITHAVSGDSVEIGTNVPYALPLHFGATIRAVNGPYLRFPVGGGWATVKEVELPARPFIGITDEDAEGISSIITHFLATAQK